MASRDELIRKALELTRPTASAKAAAARNRNTPIAPISVSGSGGVGSGAGVGNIQGSSPEVQAYSNPQPVAPVVPAYNAPAAPDARDYFRSTLGQYGFNESQINSLLNWINDKQTQNGWTAETIAANIVTTDEYRQRFKANDQRVKEGKSALSPAEYFAQEQGYREALSQAGYSKGFYDSQDDFAAWIAGDVSVAEIAARSKQGQQFRENADPLVKQQLRDYYGVTDADIEAYALDSKRTVAMLEKQYAATQLGAESLRANLGIDRTYAEGLVDSQIGVEQARNAFTTVAGEKDALDKLAKIDETNLTTRELIDSELSLDANAKKKKTRIVNNEQARFAGSGSGTESFSRNSSGSY